MMYVSLPVSFTNSSIQLFMSFKVSSSLTEINSENPIAQLEGGSPQRVCC